MVEIVRPPRQGMTDQIDVAWLCLRRFTLDADRLPTARADEDREALTHPARCSAMS
ncbi:hypothetical protein ABTX15_31405 [Micromonospora sp. NPDC094482]|uniref:hypothetical protein n=1 Tax=unclassified Micromonospora TaxID=2617518 RepID=UPI00332BE1F3